ncbi:MAG: hypothetical protein CL678_12060 [Bdellovibrionaceae bacterium]|nr:hypothetical protein [Pseudobdellovibrionaceae bacterium]|tara:strand:- start:10055 stop:10408 length:354 start_codon:yes stop_codon:yes gene_type:complete
MNRIIILLSFILSGTVHAITLEAPTPSTDPTNPGVKQCSYYSSGYIVSDLTLTTVGSAGTCGKGLRRIQAVGGAFSCTTCRGTFCIDSTQSPGNQLRCARPSSVIVTPGSGIGGLTL